MEDPISKIKEDLKALGNKCDELKAAINSSSQNESKRILEDLLNGLDKVKNNLESEFGWVMPKEE